MDRRHCQCRALSRLCIHASLHAFPDVDLCSFPHSGCWLSDPLNNWFGRRGTIFLSGIFCFFPVIGSACAQTWEQLFVCRLLLGIGMGCKGSTVPIYAAENTPALIRGGLVMSWQLWTAFGIFLFVSPAILTFERR